MKRFWFILASMSALACFSLTAWRQPLVAAENLPPCVAVSTNEHCNSPGGPGSASITHVGVWSPVCLGEMAYAWADITNVAARVVTVINYTPAGTNCPPDVNVQPEDVPYTVTWTVSGPGDYFAQGEGEDAEFTPTTNGTGTITFYLSYSNSPPCTGTGSDTKSANFTVEDQTASDSAPFLDPLPPGDPTNVIATVSADLRFCPQHGSDIRLIVEIRGPPGVQGIGLIRFAWIDGAAREVTEDFVRLTLVVGQVDGANVVRGAEKLEAYDQNGNPVDDVFPTPSGYENNGRWACIGWKVEPGANGSFIGMVSVQQMPPTPAEHRECQPPQ